MKFCFVLMSGWLMVAAQAGAQTFKVATTAPDGTVWMERMRAVAREIRQRTSGRVLFKFYPGGVMGSDTIVLRKMRVGQLHGGAVTSGALAQIYPDSQLYGLPMLFRSYEEIDAIRRQMDSFLLRELETHGLVAFGIGESGFAYLMSQQPTRRVEDLKTRKPWVLEGDVISQTFFETAGVTPIPLPVSDVYTALQTGLIDTVGSPPIGAIALQWHTRVKYLTDNPLLYTYGMLLMDRRAFRRLVPKDQRVVREALGVATDELSRLTRTDNQKAKQALRSQGIEFIQLSRQDTDSLHRVAAEANRRLGEKGIYTRSVMDQLKEHLSRYRSEDGVFEHSNVP